MLASELMEACMMRYVLPSLAALSLVAFGAAVQAAPAESAGQAKMEGMQNWSADREAMLNARLAGLKAGLNLTPDQEKLWPPFEAAVREAAKTRMERMQSMMERMKDMRDKANEAKAGMMGSPVDRMEAMANGLTERGQALKKVADAAKPLYAGLDDSQKRLFAMLGRDLWMMGHGHRGMMGMGMGGGMMGGGMGMMGGGMMGDGMMRGGMMGDVGKGMTDQGAEGKGAMGGSQGDEEDDSEDDD